MKLALIAALAITPIAAQTGPYVPKGWVMFDPQDKEGKWHLGALDKRQHFCAGAIAGITSYFRFEVAGVKRPDLWAAFVALVVGYLKEVYDVRKGGGTAEHWDAIWTGAGGFAAATTIYRVRF